MAGLIAPQHQNEDAAREHLEKLLWPGGPICPHCGIIGEAFKLNGKTTRKGLWKCSACREPFTVTVGTIFEDSKIPLHKWLLAIHLMCSSKKGISAHQLMRNLEIGSYRTAWFMAHRIRWALGQEPIASKLEGVVEIDEVYLGGKAKTGSYRYDWGVGGRPKPNPTTRKSGIDNKAPVVAMLQRGGEVHSRYVPRVTSENLKPMVEEIVDEHATVMTDSATALKFPGQDREHHTVNHRAKEYVRHEQGLTITTNTVESYFAIIQRGVNGIYHHVGKKYLDLYLREFDYRYNVRKMDDETRGALAIKKTSGRRLMLKEPRAAR
jgi:transposase-like protein